MGEESCSISRGQVCSACEGGARDERLAPADMADFWREPETLNLLVAGGALLLGILLEFVLPAALNVQLLAFRGFSFRLGLLFYGISFLISFLPTFKNALAGLGSFSIHVDVLMTAAVVGALALGHYVEAVVLIYLYAVAERMEDYSLLRAESSLAGLFEMTPETVTVLRDDEEREVAPEEVEVGEVMVVRPGERIGLDGEIVAGEAGINEATVTGESTPVFKGEGDPVYSGTLNKNGLLKVRVERPSEESTLSRIIDMVRVAEEKAGPSQRFMDYFASYYTPAVIGVALFVGVFVPLLLPVPGTFSTWFFRGLVLLVISCPCCLLISTPVAVVSGITSAARHGVLIKGGEPLETMATTGLVCFDKTGTLNEGKFQVQEVQPSGKLSPAELLERAVALEQASEHPIARAIVDEYSNERELGDVENFSVLAGRGIRGEVGGTEYYAGRPELFEAEVDDQFYELEAAGMTVICVGREAEILGYIGLADQVREGAQMAVNVLNNMGVKTVMLTGDNERTARAVAAEVGVDQYYAQLLPEEKVELVEDLQAESGVVMMVGDGVNDAPALARANVGVAMGAAGSDAALDTADVALMGDNLRLVSYVLELSQHARSVIKQNVWTSILVKLFLVLGVIPGLVNLIMAVLIGDMGVALAITYNALRLGRIHPGSSTS